jgi:hypothetical protein
VDTDLLSRYAHKRVLTNIESDLVIMVKAGMREQRMDKYISKSHWDDFHTAMRTSSEYMISAAGTVFIIGTQVMNMRAGPALVRAPTILTSYQLYANDKLTVSDAKQATNASMEHTKKKADPTGIYDGALIAIWKRQVPFRESGWIRDR